MPRARNNVTCSVTDLLDRSVEQTVRKFLKNLVCGSWKEIFDKYENIPMDDEDNEDYTEYDETNPEQREKIAVHLEHIDKAMLLWNAMVHKRNGLSFMQTAPTMPSSSRATDAQRARGRASPYIAFCKVTRPIIKSELPDLTFGDIARELGKRWKNLSPEEKKAFQQPTTPVEQETVVEESLAMPMDDERSDRDDERSDLGDEPIDRDDERSDLEDEEETMTQMERPPAREVNIVKDYVQMRQKDMNTAEKRFFSRLRKMDYHALLGELDHYNVFITESTPPTPEKEKEIINTIMNAQFCMDV